MESVINHLRNTTTEPLFYNDSTTTTTTAEPFSNSSFQNVSRVSNQFIFLETSSAKCICGIFAFSAILINFHQIFLHLRNYTCPNEQRWIVRILVFVPIYAFESWLSLLFLKHQDYYVYFDSFRDIYEGGESCIMAEIRGQEIPLSYVFGTCCFYGQRYTIEFLRFCKQPLMAILTIFLQAFGIYNHGVWNAGNGYLYVTIINNASAFVSLYALVLFYLSTNEILRPYDPILKFCVVKSTVFLCFWQVFEKTGIIPSLPGTNSGTVAAGIQNFMITIEMLIASIAFRYAFPYQLYSLTGAKSFSAPKPGMDYESLEGSEKNDHTAIGSTKHSSFQSLRDSMNPKDMLQDAIHNFHPSYQKYTQQRGFKEVESFEGDADGSEDLNSTAPPPPKQPAPGIN